MMRIITLLPFSQGGEGSGVDVMGRLGVGIVVGSVITSRAKSTNLGGLDRVCISF